MAMSPNRGAINKQILKLWEMLQSLQPFKQPLPGTVEPPATKTLVDSDPLAEMRRQVSPGNASSDHIEESFEKITVILERFSPGTNLGEDEKRYKMSPEGVCDSFAILHGGHQSEDVPHNYTIN